MEDWKRLVNILDQMHSNYQEKAVFVLLDSWSRDCQLPKNKQNNLLWDVPNFSSRDIEK